MSQPDDHPVCPHCGYDEFQVVEDLPGMYRQHAWVDGVLVFVPDFDAKDYYSCGQTYQFLECSKCCNTVDIPYRFECDDADVKRENNDRMGPARENKAVIESYEGTIESVYANVDLSVEVLFTDETDELLSDDHASMLAESKARIEAIAKDPAWKRVY